MTDKDSGKTTQVQDRPAHTPGPWAVDGNAIFTMHGHRPNVATLNAEYYANVRDANARLIAAAPDLLEALEVIMVAEFGADMKLPAESKSTYWGKASAAIAKARGELK